MDPAVVLGVGRFLMSEVSLYNSEPSQCISSLALKSRLRFRIKGEGCRMQITGCRLQNPFWFRNKGVSLRVYMQCLGFRLQGLGPGFRVEG